MLTTDHNSDSELFGVRINHEGAATLRRLTGFARWQLILGVIYSAFALARDFFSRWLFAPERYRKFFPVYLEHLMRPVYGIVISAVFVAQLIFYLRFVLGINNGVELSDTDIVNRSIDNLYRASVLFVCGIAINLLYLSLDIWGLVAILKMRG